MRSRSFTVSPTNTLPLSLKTFALANVRFVGRGIRFASPRSLAPSSWGSPSCLRENTRLSLKIDRESHTVWIWKTSVPVVGSFSFLLPLLRMTKEAPLPLPVRGHRNLSGLILFLEVVPDAYLV